MTVVPRFPPFLTFLLLSLRAIFKSPLGPLRGTWGRSKTTCACRCLSFYTRTLKGPFWETQLPAPGDCLVWVAPCLLLGFLWVIGSSGMQPSFGPGGDSCPPPHPHPASAAPRRHQGAVLEPASSTYFVFCSPQRQGSCVGSQEE